MTELDRQLIPILVAEDAISAAAIARRFGLRWGMTPRAAAELAIAVAELARNVALHAGVGEVELIAGPRGIDVVARDRGPGVLDQVIAPCSARATSERSAQTGDQARSGGLGLGRGAVRRLMDEMDTRPREGGGWEVACRKHWA
jgi:serine/threonine-protein kinase RsbT